MSLEREKTSIGIFAGNNSLGLGIKIGERYGQSLGKYSLKKFSDGEMSFTYNESIRGCDIFLVQSTCPPSDNIMELLFMIDAAKRASARCINVVIPYFGYARQDKKEEPRVSIAAKLMADILSCAGSHRIMTMDLHSGPIQGFFNIPVDHLDSNGVFIPYIESLQKTKGLENFVFVSPDMGGVTRNRNYANYFHSDMVICDKQRKKANEVHSMQVIGEVKGKNIILVDDIVDTGSTLYTAASIIKKKGAKSIRAICTHAILSSADVYEKIEQSEIEELIVTDTVPLKKASPKIKVLSVADIFAKAIHNVAHNLSISFLYKH